MKKIILLLLISVKVFAADETIVFAGGCFWGVEKYFDNVVGVKSATSGYAGGNYPNPTYETVLKYKQTDTKEIKNYTESVKVVFDNQKIKAENLIKIFWELHDPTQKNRQGNDVGNNYRSAIFYTTNEQYKMILKTKDEYQKLLSNAGYGKIVTQIEKLDKFYNAEDYHQDYLKRNPNGYCPNHSTGIKFKKIASSNDMIKPLGGKEIIVIKEKFCPYCEKFEKDVISLYKGDIPIRTVYFKQLKDFKLKTEVYGTPTIYFIDNKNEVNAYTGYMNNKNFYKALALFKLGKGSKSFNIAFNQGTENRFCKKYDLFKNVSDGIFVDKLSGEPLFDTKDRFNSNSGWLSFYKAIDGSTIELPDNSYGMKRIEVKAKVSNIHLGHVFDYENGKRRFCINANVLDFVKRSDIK